MSGYRQKLVQHWNDWQLSVLVLLSLSLQLLLLFSAGLRRRAKPSWWRKTYFWALHIGSRFIATYCLGILSRASAGDANADIQAFWASLLIFHLGGPDDFTALSLEDNKLWDRHCFTLSIQVLTTAYVFFHYFLDVQFRRFIAPFVLISLAGLLKCIEQVVALKHATMEALVESVLGTPDAGPDYADTMDRVDGMLRAGVLPSLNIDNERLGRPNSDAREADETGTHQNKGQQRAVNIARSAHELFSRFKVLFADGIFSFEDRREGQGMFSGQDMDWAFRVIEVELSFVYDRLYTKASVSRTKIGTIIRVISLLLTLAGSLWAFFVTLHATPYRLRHRCVMYTLLTGAVLTDSVILARHIYSIWSLVHSDWLECCSVDLVLNRSRWSGYMAQSNLITFCLKELPSESELLSFSRRLLGRVPDIPITHRLRPGAFLFAAPVAVAAPATVAAAAAVLGTTAGTAVRDLLASDAFQTYLQRSSVLEQLQSKSFWKNYKKTTYVPVQDRLKAFIFEELKKKEKIFNERENERTTGTPDDRKPFTDCRGDWVLEKENVLDLGWSVQEKEFDESLLLWHIATDLCFRKEVNPGNGGNSDQQVRQEIDPGNDNADQQACQEVNPGNAREHRVRQVPVDREIAREISNYLIYIMVVHPLMLSSSTTMATKRCRDTCAEARRHFLKEHIRACARRNPVSEENAHDLLLKVETPLPASVLKGDKSKSVLWDGCSLAKQLEEKLKDEEDEGKKWRVICKVWVEMLCYAAVHCGGYQHAERLSEGGELLTFVCLLMTHLGMGKHYRTQVGDAYAHLSPYTA